MQGISRRQVYKGVAGGSQRKENVASPIMIGRSRNVQTIMCFLQKIPNGTGSVCVLRARCRTGRRGTGKREYVDSGNGGARLGSDSRFRASRRKIRGRRRKPREPFLVAGEAVQPNREKHGIPRLCAVHRVWNRYRLVVNFLCNVQKVKEYQGFWTLIGVLPWQTNRIRSM